MRKLVLLLPLLFACTTASLEDKIPGTASSSLAQTYTGVLQRTGGATKDYVNLAQTVTVRQPNPFELSFASSAFPTFTAVIVSTGSAATTVSPVNYTEGTGVEVQQVAFVTDKSGHTVLVIQTASGLDAGADGELVQFASYDPSEAPPESAVEAVDYLDEIIDLASSK